jgi:hypothetical protein
MAIDINQARRIQRYYAKKLYDATAQLIENPDFEGQFGSVQVLASCVFMF